jgi:dTMP kinase
MQHDQAALHPSWLERSWGAVTPPGLFVVLEGIDGCGKTTQLERLREWLPTSGLLPPGARLLTSREPGGTPLGQALRELLLHPPAEAAPCSDAELLLYAADRAQHVARVIRPALEAGDWVICDRFTGSTVAYQGYGRGLPLERIAALEGFATGGLEPDLTLWLELPLDESLRRRRGRAADRIEASGHAFLERVAAGFSTLARERGWQRVDALQSSEMVSRDCQAKLRLHAAAGAVHGRADG